MSPSVRKRTKAERAKDTAEMMALHLRGKSQQDIAVRLGLTQSQVCRDLNPDYSCRPIKEAFIRV